MADVPGKGLGVRLRYSLINARPRNSRAADPRSRGGSGIESITTDAPVVLTGLEQAALALRVGRPEVLQVGRVRRDPDDRDRRLRHSGLARRLRRARARRGEPHVPRAQLARRRPRPRHLRGRHRRGQRRRLRRRSSRFADRLDRRHGRPGHGWRRATSSAPPTGSTRTRTRTRSASPTSRCTRRT